MQQSKYNLPSAIMVLLAFIFCISASFAEEIQENGKNYKYGDEFSSLLRRLDYNPDDIGAGDSLRAYCRQNAVISQCIEELNQLAEKYPKNKIVRYQAALAYVDEVPGHSLFKQGWLSTRSMDHAAVVLEQNPNDWTALYIKGLNGVYWPKSFRKLPGAIEDLQQCVAITEKLPKGLKQPYHGMAYIALGDAYVKDDNIAAGREVYQKGLQAFDSAKLRQRLAMSDEELTNFIKEFRNTDTRVDTELSFLVNGGQDKL